MVVAVSVSIVAMKENARMAKPAEGSSTIDTALGKVEYIEHGEGAPVLFVHGSPGGCDQGAVMTEFLVPKGFRTVSLSRPG
jgi:hypothetical protein